MLSFTRRACFPRSRAGAGTRRASRAVSGLVGALDQGTSSTRFMLFDHAGQVVGLQVSE